MGSAVNDLLDVLREARSLLALPQNDFGWSSWDDGGDALAEMDELIDSVESGRLPPRLGLDVLFAPTGPIQEVSINSGWAAEFLSLASRFDDAVRKAYSYRTWWLRILNWNPYSRRSPCL